MLPNTACLTGTWGEEKLRSNQTLQSHTAYREFFGDANIRAWKEKQQYPLAKFRNLREDGTMILKYTDKKAHSKSTVRGWGTAPLDEDSISQRSSMVRISLCPCV